MESLDDKYTVKFNKSTFHVIANSCDPDYTWLADPSEWNNDWVEYCNKIEGLSEITDEHYKVIDVLQNYQKEYHGTPSMVTLCERTGYNLRKIYRLFPSGQGKGACRMAGLSQSSE